MSANEHLKNLFKTQADAVELTGDVWEEEPVSPREFFAKFIHEPCYPMQQEFVDKILGTEAKEWDSTFAEGIALVGKGGGKDRTISKILAYCIYKLLCMKNPQRFLGLNDNTTESPESAIDIGNVSINARLAKDVFFKTFVAIIKATKNPKTGGNWFEEHGLNLDRDILTKEIKFPKGITTYSLDSEEYTGEGLNLLMVIFDEVGGFKPEPASNLYTALVSSQKTRFGDKRKTLLISYKRDDNDFMMIRYNQAENVPKTYRVRAATWEWNPKRKKEDFSEDYLKAPEDAKRIYECLGSTSKEGYFKYKQRIKEAVNPNRLNPVAGYMKDGEFIEDERIWTDDILSLRFKEFFRPIRGVDYFVHVDLSKGKESGDYAGFTLSHFIRNQDVRLSEEYIKELTKVEGFKPNQLLGQKQIGVVIDLLLQLRAKPGQEIIFDDIRQFIQGLRSVGFNIKMVTYDGWQSVDSIQLLKKQGIEAEVLSVDRNTEAYDTLKEQLYKGLLDVYEHKTFIRECEELIRKPNGKIDHPELSYRRSVEEGRKEGSKDVGDSVAGCVANPIKHAKASFSFGVTGVVDNTDRGVRRPDDDERDKLVRYGEKP